MKKLSKIKLQDAVVLENREMKMISGGSGGAGWCDFSDGTSVLSGCKSDADCKSVYGEGKCSTFFIN